MLLNRDDWYDISRDLDWELSYVDPAVAFPTSWSGAGDVPKDAWDKWSADALKHKKAISDAQRRLNDARGLAELSLSRPNGATVDASQYDGQLVTKEITINATVRDPKGQTASKPLKAILQRAVVKNEKSEDLKGRWIVTSVAPA